MDYNNATEVTKMADNTSGVFTEQETPYYNSESQVVFTVFLALIFLFGVLGNMLVILVVCLNRNMKTSVNIYLVNLCIADILVLTVCMPAVLVDIYARDVWYFGDSMCSVVPFLENTVVHASILTLIAISVERCRVVCQPLRGIRDNVVKNAKAVPVIWIICAVCNVPWFFIAEYRDSSHKDGTPIKVCRLPMTSYWNRCYVVALCVLYFIIPFLILLILYCRICYILRSPTSDTNTGSLRNSQQIRHRHKLRVQVMNIIICLVLLFFIFHLPYRVVSMWFTFADIFDIHKLGMQQIFNITYSARIFFYFNHAINPIIYNFVSTKFKSALRNMFTKRKYRAHLVSSKPKRSFDKHLTKPIHQHSQLVLTEKYFEHEKCVCTSRCASSRQNMNEFFPMYANIIQNHDNTRYYNEHDGAKTKEICET